WPRCLSPRRPAPPRPPPPPHDAPRPARPSPLADPPPLPAESLAIFRNFSPILLVEVGRGPGRGRQKDGIASASADRADSPDHGRTGPSLERVSRDRAALGLSLAPRPSAGRSGHDPLGDEADAGSSGCFAPFTARRARPR